MLGFLYSLKILFSKKIVYIVAGAVIAYVLVSFYYRFTLFSLSLVPLSKEIVISHFPYWNQDEWVYKANIGFPYANYSSYGASMPLPFIFLFLLIYLVIVNIFPVLVSRQNYLEKKYGIDSNNLKDLCKNQSDYHILELKQYRWFSRITIKEGNKKKKIILKNK